MKKILYLIMLSSLCFQYLTAQVTQFPWNEEFNNSSLPTGWTANTTWQFSNGYAQINYLNSMLITPQLQIPPTSTNQAVFLSYMVATTESAIAPNFVTLVSTSGINPENFSEIDNIFLRRTSNAYSFASYSINLSTYEGQSIYIAFQVISGLSTSSRWLYLDNIWIGLIELQPSFITEYPWFDSFEESPAATNWSTGGWGFRNGHALIYNTNQMLITPQLQLPISPVNKAIYICYIISGDAYEGTNSQILVSTTGNNPADFIVMDTLPTLYDSLISSYERYSHHYINLSQYEGSAIYIGFQNIGEAAYLYIRDVWVGEADEQPPLITDFPWSETFNVMPAATNWINDGWGFGNGYANIVNNNRMFITPPLQLPVTHINQALLLSYSISSCRNSFIYYPSQPDYIEVLISTTGTSPADFLTVDMISIDSMFLLPHTIDLSQYEGQVIYIGFQKTAGLSGYILLDDVWVGEVGLQPSMITVFPWHETFENVTSTTNWLNNNWGFYNGYAMTYLNNNMLITPQLQLPDTDINHAIFIDYKTSSYPIYTTNSNSEYKILVSTTGNNIEDFIEYSTDIAWPNYAPFTRQANITQYNGEAIYIAFLKSGGDSTYLSLDDIVVNSELMIISEFPWVESFSDSSRPIGWISNIWDFTDEMANGMSLTRELITPQLQLPAILQNQTVYLIYKVGSIQSNYRILISNTGYNSEDFSVKYTGLIVTDYQVFQTRSLDISEYSGQNINIGFQGTSDIYYLYVDDVCVILPEPPNNLTAIQANNSIYLSWNEPLTTPINTTLLGYKVYRDGLAITSLITDTTFQDNTVTNGNEYTYYITSEYTLEMESGTEPITVALDNIIPPNNILATVQEYSVILNWSLANDLPQDINEILQIYKHSVAFIDENGDKTTRALLGYKVYRGTTLVTALPILGTTFTDENVPPGTYTYKVSALYSNGESTLAEISNVVVYNLLPPVDLLTTITNTPTVNLSWEAPEVIGIERYKVYRKAGVEVDYTLLYQTVNQEVLTYFDTNVENGFTYQYNIIAVYPTGESPQSDIITAKPALIIPWVEGFTSNTLPPNWANTGGWAFSGGYTYTTGNNMLVTPLLLLPETSAFLIYEVWSSGSASTAYDILVSTGDKHTQVFNTITSSSITGLERQTRFVNLAPYADDTVFIAFQKTGTGGIVFLDNFNVAPLQPTPPNNLQATPIEAEAIVLGWVSPEQEWILGYNVYRRAVTENEFALLYQTSDNTVHEYADTCIACDGTIYHYYVTATFPTGESGQSNMVITTNLPTPVNLTASVDNYSVSLQWESGVDGTAFFGYNVYRDDLLLIEEPIYETTFTESNIAPGIYSYKVSAINSAGESRVIELPEVAVYNILPPVNLLASNEVSLSVKISWETQSTFGITHYKVFRKSNIDGEYTEIHQTESNEDITYIDADVVCNGTTYYYYLTAVYFSGESGQSEIVFATPAVTAYPYTESFASETLPVNWTNNGAWLVDSEYVFTEGANMLITPLLQLPNTPLLLVYDVWSANGENPLYEILISTSGIGEQSFTSIDIQTATSSVPESRYLSLTGYEGETAYIAFRNFGIGGTLYLDSVNIGVASQQMLPPVNVYTYSTGALSIGVCWQSPNITGVLSYKVHRRVGTVGAFAPIYQTTSNTTLSYIDSAVENGQAYFYYVTACYPVGESEPSSIASASPNAIYNPVTDLNAVVGFNSVALSWEEPAVEASSATLSGYKIVRGGVLLIELEDTVYTDNTAVNGVAYVYSVIAVYTGPVGESVAVTANVQMKVFNAPTELFANAGNAQVVLNWEAPDPHVHSAYLVGYNVYRDGVVIVSGVTDTNYTDEGLTNGTIYIYYVVAVYTSPVGVSEPTETVSATPERPSGDEDDVVVPVATKLGGNYPNPFNPTTTIAYEMASEGRVVIEIYNFRGQKIRTLVNGVRSVGSYNVVWDGHDDSGNSISSGIYFYRMTCKGYVGVKKMLLLK